MESESLRRRSPPSSPADDFIQIEETMAAKQPDNTPVTAGRGGTTTGGSLEYSSDPPRSLTVTRRTESIGASERPRPEERMRIQTDKDRRNYILVTCGEISGELYTDKFHKGLGSKVFEKCIKYKEKMVSPQEFESLGGKKTSKQWKRSIKHNSKPLTKWLEEGSLKELVPAAALPILRSQATAATQSPTRQDSTSQGFLQVGAQDEGNSFEIFERKLLSTVESTIRNAIESLKISLEQRIAPLYTQMDLLNKRVQALEEKSDSRQCNNSTQEDHLSTLQSELNVLSKSVSNHQKLLEQNERETRANNIVIVGLKETEDENEDTIEKVNKIMEEKMNLSHTGIVKAHRLGKKGNSPSIPRPVLVSFNSIREKSRIMSKRSSLAGSNIYFNNDLTKNQRADERKLRATKKILQSNPEYADKKITIYKGKLCIDGTPIQVPDSVVNV